MRITTRYAMNKVTLPYVIACGCGKKLRRVASTFYTLNPFNQLTTHEANREKCRAELRQRIERETAKGATCKACAAHPAA